MPSFKPIVALLNICLISYSGECFNVCTTILGLFPVCRTRRGLNHLEEHDTKPAFVTSLSLLQDVKVTLLPHTRCTANCPVMKMLARVTRAELQRTQKKESWVSAKQIFHHFPLSYNLVVLVELRSRHRGKAIAIHHVRLCRLDVIANP